MSIKIKYLSEDDLLDVFYKACSELIEIESVMEEINGREDEINNIYSMPVMSWSVGKTIGFWFLGYIGFSMAIMLPILILAILKNGTEIPTFANTGPFFGMIISTIFIIIKRKSIKTKIQKRNQEQVEFLKDEINVLNQKLDGVIEKRADKLLLIPEPYRYSLAIETMQGYITNMLASSWSECAKLYEEQMHRWTLEGNSQEALALQYQIARSAEGAQKNSKAAAIFSGISAVASVARLIKR